MRQRVEQRRLAGIGVANQRNAEHIATHPRLALHATLARQLGQALLQQLDPIAKQAAVGLQLLFTRPPHADATALPFQVSPAANQPGRQMLQLRQFDLQLALGARGPQGKNIENQTGAVDDAAFQQAFQIALLGRRQIMVENYQISLTRRHHGTDLVDLAFASIGFRIGLWRRPKTSAATTPPADSASRRTSSN
jgi:hypothetical protein